MRSPSLVAVLAILTVPLFAEQTDHSGWQYDAVMPEHLSENGSNTATDINAVNIVLAKLRDRWNAHDLDGYLSAYWNSSQLLIVLGDEQIQGWQALRDSYRDRYPDSKMMGTMQYSRIQLKFSNPGLALAKTSWSATYPNSNGEVLGDTTLNLQRFDDGWKVISAFSNYVRSTSRGWEYDSIAPDGSSTMPSPDRNDIEAINDLLMKELSCWNAHDIDGYLSVLWKSPQLLVILQAEQYQGWQSIADAYKSGFKDPNAMGSISPSRIQIKLVKPDLANAVTWWTVSFPTSKVRVLGNTTMNLQKFSDGWKVVLAHSSFIEP
jgi:ketosteroid isomerase-like protein